MPGGLRICNQGFKSYTFLQGQMPIKGQYFDAQWDLPKSHVILSCVIATDHLVFCESTKVPNAPFCILWNFADLLSTKVFSQDRILIFWKSFKKGVKNTQNCLQYSKMVLNKFFNFSGYLVQILNIWCCIFGIFL